MSRVEEGLKRASTPYEATAIPQYEQPNNLL